VAEGEELGSNILHVDARNSAHLSAWRRGRPPSSAPRVEIVGDERPARTDMPIVPRVTHRRRADRRRKPCDALNLRWPQRLGRALRVAGLRARAAAIVAVLVVLGLVAY
jgi:hypothetical protein